MRFLAVLLVILFASLPLVAQEKHATLDILPSQSSVQIGGDVDIAIRQTIRGGWHTYWLNAGDSGEGMTIEWDIPDGVEITDLYHPTPERINYDPLVNFGFYGRPVFKQTISVSDDFIGDVLRLSGQAYWLVCNEVCIPESQDISITIPVGDGGVPVNQTIFQDIENTHPIKVDWATKIIRDGDVLNLQVDIPTDLHNQMTDVDVFPYDWGLILPTSETISDIGDTYITFSQKIGQRDWRELMELNISDFVIKTPYAAYQITGDFVDGALSDGSDGRNIVMILLFAFIGGLILNLMPCVFPILSMKALSLVKLSGFERSHARASGVAYTIGIVVSFLMIAGLLIALKSGGETIGWGFQLQSPYIVAFLAALLFVIGLNLIGFFELRGRFATLGSGYAGGKSLKASFWTGILATLVATPCTAPFMASAIGYALIQPPAASLLIFASIGFGLAFPYLLLTFIPSAQKILPKPGPWMEKFRNILAFPMFLSAAWLVWVLTQQSGHLSVLYILCLFTAIVFMIWVFKNIQSGYWKTGFAIVLFGLFTAYAPILKISGSIDYIDYSPTTLQETLMNNPEKPVFVNMSAAWCITCLVNERMSLSDKSVRQAIEDNDIIYIKGDWTNHDADITTYIESFGRSGVPLYIYYGTEINGQRPEAEILPQILTPKILLDKFNGNKEAK